MFFFQAAYVYTPEVYPTVLRSIGVGSCSGMARLGATLTPYIAQVLMKKSLHLAVGVYVSVALIAAFSCLLFLLKPGVMKCPREPITVTNN